MVDRKELHETIDKYGLLHKKTIEVSQRLDKNVADKQLALLKARKVEGFYMQGLNFEESMSRVKNEVVEA